MERLVERLVRSVFHSGLFDGALCRRKGSPCSLGAFRGKARATESRGPSGAGTAPVPPSERRPRTRLLFLAAGVPPPGCGTSPRGRPSDDAPDRRGGRPASPGELKKIILRRRRRCVEGFHLDSLYRNKKPHASVRRRRLSSGKKREGGRQMPSPLLLLSSLTVILIPPRKI